MNSGIAEVINLKRGTLRDKDLQLDDNPEDKAILEQNKIYNKERPRYDLRKPKALEADVDLKNSFMGVEANEESQNRVVEEYKANSLYAHVTAFFTVDSDPKKFHYITPETAQFVNTNGDAWERRLALKRFGPDFRNAYNFEEHIQIPRLNRGVI